MLDKYTIFDNFDKLDLSPVAARFTRASDLSVATGGETGLINLEFGVTSKTLEKNLNNINFIKANETVYDGDSGGDNRYRQQVEPYNVTPQNFGSPNSNAYLPDFFRYITNRRFYLDNNLNIKYVKNSFQDFEFNAKNLFLTDFYFQFADITTLNRQITSNNFLYSKRNNIITNSDYISLETFLEGTSVNVNFDGLLDPVSDSNKINPFLNGINRVLFSYDKGSNKLLTKDLFDFPNATSQMNYLFTETLKSETYRNSFLILMQRLLYPIATQVEIPTRHIYFVTDLKKAVDETKVKDMLPYSNYDIVKVKSHYNFYSTYSEDFSSGVIAEWQLPNAYTYYSFLNSKKQNKLFKYYSDLIKINPYGAGPENLDTTLEQSITFQKYYEYTNASILPSVGLPSDEESAANMLNVLRNRNISFGSGVQKITKDVDAIKNIFPYFNKVDLPSIKSNFMHKLQQQNFLDVFMSLIGNYFGDRATDKFGKSVSPNIIPGGIDYRKGALHTFSGVVNDLSDEKATSVFASTMQILDMHTLSQELQKYKNYLFDSSLVKFASNSVFVPEKQEDSILSDYNISALNDVLKDYCKYKAISYDEIDNGKKCYSEMLGFEVVKSAISNGRKTTLQSFFIPCIGDNPTSYIDTQIFYDKEYVYEVYSISLIVGTRYYSELGRKNNLVGDNNQPEFSLNEKVITKEYSAGQDEFFNNQLTISDDLILPPGDIPGFLPVLTEPRPIIVRAPYYNNASFGAQKTIKLLDKPPLPPEMSFYPYKDISNKVLIFMNVNYGERKLSPVGVFASDYEMISKYYQSQMDLEIDKNSLIKRILYRTDDFNGIYKIYRTDKMPLKWSDFDEQPIAEIRNAQSSGFESEVQPNIDYYYFARFEDIHGNISNPTDIFKLRMVKEGGFPPYMLLKTYTFAEARGKLVREKSFKKYLKIRLADGVRKYLNTDDITKTDIAYKKLVYSSMALLTPYPEEVKKYKIRITSKQTGKKIDVNLDFKKSMSEKYLSKDMETEKQSLALDLINKEKNKAETKSSFINMDDMASQYNEKTKVFAPENDILLQTDTTISFIDKQN